MLRVTIELVPGGDEDRAHVIEQMTIANISDLADVSDYDYAFTERGKIRYGRKYGHHRADGAWDLVWGILDMPMSICNDPQSYTQKRLAERFLK